jgi:hypothetical protein
MRIVFKDEPVYVGSGIAFVGICDYILVYRGLLLNRSPFLACRKTGAAPAAQGRCFYEAYQILRLFFEGLSEGLIASAFNIRIECSRAPLTILFKMIDSRESIIAFGF